MGKKYFSVDEVNELIPQLEHHFQQMLSSKREMSKAAVQLRKMGLQPELLESSAFSGSPEAEVVHRRLQSQYFSFKQHLLSVERIGGEIKDLELGRVDFPCLENGQESRLTWQLGVTEAAYRHPVAEEGVSHPFDRSKILKVG